MRITNSTLTTNFLRNISKNLKQMESYQNQLSSGKVVTKSSDNPMLVSKIMNLNNNIMQNEQYNTNIGDTIGLVETQDSALGGVTAGLQRIRELIVYGANGSLADTDRAAIKDEVNMEIQGLADVLNTNFDGRYVFGGQKTTNPPFAFKDNILEYNGDGNNSSLEISKGVMVDLITDGSSITTATNVSPGNEKLGIFLNKVMTAMDNGDTEALSGELLGDIDKHLDTVIRVRSKVGAINNRLEAAQARNETENLNLTKILSEREDIDIAEKYMEYSVMKSVYQASLSAGASVLQPSLLDFLR